MKNDVEGDVKKIVVVEDSLPTLRMLTIALQRLGFDVEAFANAELALEPLRSHLQPNLILTDLHMPGMSGLELIQQIKKIERLDSVPVLILTAETTQEFKQQARDMGAQGWLVKPITRAKLMDVIQRFL